MYPRRNNYLVPCIDLLTGDAVDKFIQHAVFLGTGVPRSGRGGDGDEGRNSQTDKIYRPDAKRCHRQYSTWNSYDCNQSRFENDVEIELEIATVESRGVGGGEDARQKTVQKQRALP